MVFLLIAVELAPVLPFILPKQSIFVWLKRMDFCNFAISPALTAFKQLCVKNYKNWRIWIMHGFNKNLTPHFDEDILLLFIKIQLIYITFTNNLKYIIIVLLQQIFGPNFLYLKSILSSLKAILYIWMSCVEWKYSNLTAHFVIRCELFEPPFLCRLKS